MRGPTAGEGYWNQRAKSRRTFAGEWTYTGDKFSRDADGYYHYCGRTDDMFKVSGMWVSPFEVEAALARMKRAPRPPSSARKIPTASSSRRRSSCCANGYHADERTNDREAARAREGNSPARGNIRAGSIFGSDLPRTATGKI